MFCLRFNVRSLSGSKTRTTPNSDACLPPGSFPGRSSARSVPVQCPSSARHSARQWKFRFLLDSINFKKEEIIDPCISFFRNHGFCRKRIVFIDGHCDGHCDGHWTGIGRALYGRWTEVSTTPSGDQCGQSSRTAPGQTRSPYLSQLWLKFRLRFLSALWLKLGVGLGWVSICVLFRSGKTMTR